jgi:hypothetical protein
MVIGYGTYRHFQQCYIVSVGFIGGTYRHFQHMLYRVRRFYWWYCPPLSTMLYRGVTFRVYNYLRYQCQ